MIKLNSKVVEMFDLSDSDYPMNDMLHIIYGDSERFRIVESEKTVESARRHDIKNVVVEDTYSESPLYIAIEFSRGKTEMQDFGIEDVSAYYVTPVESVATVTDWLPVQE